MKDRIQKIIAQAGVCSRRAAEDLIAQGRVTVNGRKVTLGAQADGLKDRIAIDGKPIADREPKVTIMLNKPRGYVTTLKDEHGRKTVASLVRGCGARVFPVGRLDYESEGLLIMTNDGELAQLLTHPSHQKNKVYHVTVRGDLSKVEKLGEPMKIDDYDIEPATIYMLGIDEEKKTARIEMTIHEGRNRQIRKMCEQLGLEVRRLKRMKMNRVSLDPSLAAGKWRALMPSEMEDLQK